MSDAKVATALGGQRTVKQATRGIPPFFTAVIQTYENEIFCLLKLLYPDTYVARMMEQPEDREGENPITICACILASREFKWILVIATSK